MLRATSLYLNERLGGRAYFQSVVVVVPRSWDPSACGYTADFPAASTAATAALARDAADLLMGPDHPVYGGAPHAQHSGGCGAAGELIYLPISSILVRQANNSASSTAAALMESWLEYRYGVFREETYPGDRLYPNMFASGGGGANGTAEPDPMMPNRQLVLCGGRSADEVIQAHADFVSIRTDNEPMRAIIPEIRVVQQQRVRYVLAIETTASMGLGEHWKWVNKAAQKLIRYDLPANASLAVVTFNNVTRVEHPMTVLRDEDTRAKLADTIPGKYHLTEHSARCVACMLQALVPALQKAEEGDGESVAGTHLILITRGGSDSLSLTDEKIISDYVKNYGIRISPILLPSTGIAHLPFYDDIASLSGGWSYLVPQSIFPMDTLVSVLDAFQNILAEDADSSQVVVTTIHSGEHYTGNSLGGSNTSHGTFTMEANFDGDTVFGIYVEDPEDHLIKSISLEDEEGTLYGPYTKVSTTFDLINFKTVNVVGESPLKNHAVTRWRYTIHWFTHTGPARKNLIRVTTATSPEKVAQMPHIQSWAVQRQSFRGFSPIEVFVEVNQGRSIPIVGARVYVTAEIINDNGTLVAATALQLNDDGLGDSDLMVGDGLYSAFITEYPATGRFSFTINVEDNNGAAYIVAQGGQLTAAGQQVCCGSYLEVPRSRRMPTGRFNRTVRGPIIRLTGLPSEEDFAPPAKIGDLNLELSLDNRTILAGWTAPGGDFNAGSVAGYRFVYSSNISHLLGAKNEMQILETIEKSTDAGSHVTHMLEFTFYNQDYFIGLYAFDTAGNRGRLSNIQHVFVLEPPPPPSATLLPLPPGHLGLPPSTSTDWMMIIAISCGLGALLIVCLLAIAYYLFSSRRRRPESPSPSNSSSNSSTTKEDLPGADQTDSSSCHSDRQGSSAHLDVKGQDRHQVTDLHQILGQEQGSSRITPVYWSASQLLSKLDYPERGSAQAPPAFPDSFQNQAYGYYGTSSLGRSASSSYGREDLFPGGGSAVAANHPAATAFFDLEKATTRLPSSMSRSQEQESARERSPNSQERQPSYVREPSSSHHLPHQPASRPSRFERNHLYRSSRLNRTYDGEAEEDEEDEVDSYQGFGTPLPPVRAASAEAAAAAGPHLRHHRGEDIPEEFCVTVSSISTSDTDSVGRSRPPGILPKPRNITEV